MQNAALSVAIMAMIVALKRVLSMRGKTYRGYFASRISAQEFEHQAAHHTRMEVLKLQNSSEYKYLTKVKGKAAEEWNWQTKEGGAEGKRESSGSRKNKVGAG